MSNAPITVNLKAFVAEHIRDADGTDPTQVWDQIHRILPNEIAALATQTTAVTLIIPVDKYSRPRWWQDGRWEEVSEKIKSNLRSFVPARTPIFDFTIALG